MGLTLPERRALRGLAEAPGGKMELWDFRQTMKVTPIGSSRIATRLVDDGYCDKILKSGEWVGVSITEEGVRMIQSGRADGATWVLQNGEFVRKDNR